MFSHLKQGRLIPNYTAHVEWQSDCHTRPKKQTITIPAIFILSENRTTSGLAARLANYTNRPHNSFSY